MDAATKTMLKNADFAGAAKLADAAAKEMARHCDTRIARMQVVLGFAKNKLELYRAQHSGEYVGGVEYSALMRQIDEALRVGK